MLFFLYRQHGMCYVKIIPQKVFFPKLCQGFKILYTKTRVNDSFDKNVEALSNDDILLWNFSLKSCLKT